MTKLIFPYSITIKLDWSEMDLFGHINNVSYFKYIKASRVNYWEQSGIYELFTTKNIGPILASVKCDFIKPLHYPGQCFIKSRIEFIGNSSFGIYHQIFNAQKDLCAEAHDVIVLFDFNQNMKAMFPDDLKIKIEQLQGKFS
jgi:acyl-CoA thioester hydrolase